MLDRHQSALLRAVEQGHNAVVDCVPGSGKTTCALQMVERMPHAQFWIITYNRDLKNDTQVRLRVLGATNCVAANYHGFCCAHYAPGVHTDVDIRRRVLDADAPLRLPATGAPHVLVVDEAQDMNPTYFRLICKILKDVRDIPQIVVLGDTRQSIYAYSGADPKFLSEAARLYPGNGRVWKRARFALSHRLTRPMAAALNRSFLGGADVLRSEREGSPVQYWCVNVHDVHKRLVAFLFEDFKPEEVLVLAPSVRTSNRFSPLAKIVNLLVKAGWPVEVQNDETKGSAKCTRHKVLVTTYHRSKGLGRKCVVVLSADASYFEYFDKTSDPNACTNAQYVALTRSFHTLIVVQHHAAKPLAFLGDVDSDPNIEVVREPLPADGPSPPAPKPPVPRGVCAFLRHLPETALERARGMLQCTPMPLESLAKLSLPAEVRQGALTERVSDLVGIALGLYFADLAPAQPLRMERYVTMALDAQSRDTGLDHRKRQIREREWPEAGVAECARGRFWDMLAQIDANAAPREWRSEVRVTGITPGGEPIVGSIDFCLNNHVLVELKCTSDLTSEACVQLAAYMYLSGSRKGYLVNPLTNTAMCIEATAEALACMMRCLEKARNNGHLE